MKYNYLMVVLLASLCSTLQAQKKDTTQVNVKIVTGTKDSIHEVETHVTYSQSAKKEKNKTAWFQTYDLGFNNFSDHSNYAASNAAGFTSNFNENSMDLKSGKSINVGIWIFEQLVPIYKHNINLYYGVVLDLNNYRFKNNVRFNKNGTAATPTIYIDETANNHYKKTKLAADYIKIPLMLNFNFSKKSPTQIKSVYKTEQKSVSYSFGSNKGYGLSIGGSIGYLYTARNKFVNDLDGKKKVKDDFGLRPWKISYEAEVNLGSISFYGSYSPNSLFKNHLDMNPYTFGIRF
ncbi:MAG: hypothetical protein E6Q89_03630 [Bacteroidia bacterium]|nr:MAG: hypothetical protein E6Q89_03630 [Bacteroidia bacterium]